MYARTARARTTGMPIAVCDATYELEFRSTVDDAWYSVRVVLDDDTLVVNFLNFSEAHDERFRAGDFETAKAVDEFVERFRPVSQQLQDSQCSSVIEGMTVCASFAFGQDDVRFYDAVVEDVQYVEHSFAKGEEECLCNFILFWHHGPNEGNKMPATVTNICLLQPFAQIDSRVVSFSKMAKEKFVTASLMSASVSGVKTSLCKGGVPDYENINLSTNPKCSLFQSEIQVKKSFRYSGSSVKTEEVAAGLGS
ncbi:uncharacterized protein LOC127791866 isoform X3 [Diospyros lotus]|uniref:uncharacterized protein LOC127791866 isoform X3 n=1 Tax=Diospyros lotus TaxID=55363 RepID=UPI00225885BB|nr:uncharacterized protein LOC127791866 isoform X3 [Diospyros lotus]